MRIAVPGSGRVYHYTNQAGLLGILTGPTEEYVTLPSVLMWATQIGYLNDREEFRHAITVMLEEASGLPEDTPGAEVLKGGLERVLQQPTKADAYVCSFSEDDDSLPQWRAYGGTAGYAIGVDPNQAHFNVSERTTFGPCIYREEEQRSEARKQIELLLASAERNDSSFLVNLARRAVRFSPRLKHRKFEDEREWRLIAWRSYWSNRELQFRQGRSTVVPYISIPIAKRAIVEVVVGPTPLQEAACHAVETLLKDQGFSAEVRPSVTPYRSW